MLQKSVFLISFILMSVCIINAQVPQLINYQGVLTDAAGKSISGSRSIQFSLYNSATGGTAIWDETQTVTVTDGLFNVLLGSVKPVPYTVFNGSDKYLSLKIGSDPEMTPRKRLVSVGYSFRAYDADKVDGKDAAAFVQKVDGVSPANDGNIDLVAGTNVTITPDIANNKITISGGGGDNLGNHTATQNIKLNGNWLSGDGGNEGVFVNNNGDIGIGTTSLTEKLQVAGNLKLDYNTKGIMLDAADYPMITRGFDTFTTGKYVNVGRWGLFMEPHTLVLGIPNMSNKSVRVKAFESNSIGTDLVTIMQNGNVGVGTNDPSGAKLKVIQNGSDRAGFFQNVNANSPYEALLANTNNNREAIYATTYGTGRAAYIGIGNANNNSNALEVHTGGPSGCAVYGHSSNSGGGRNYGGIFKASGSTGIGMYAETPAATGFGIGVYGVSKSNLGRGGMFEAPATGIGIEATGGLWAGYFNGKVHVTGTLSKGGGAFMIDHPLEPTTKYLSHSFVESPDMMNIYNGNITLDANGEAWVTLPDWFEALNKDFRYQLTCIGGFAPLYIDKEISNNQFKIAGGKPGIKVSWQVTGIRHDPFAEANRIQVETAKKAEEQGKYLHPKEYGVPETMGIEYQKKQELPPPAIEEIQHSEEKNP
jgi:hypothetical protein